MGFSKQRSRTGKMSILKELKKEIEELNLYSIAKKYKENQIPPSLVINLDQTPSMYVPGCNKTLAEKGNKTASIACSTDKRMIMTTFSIILSGNFLPVKLIHGE